MTEREALKLALKALEAAYARLVTKCEQNLVTYNGVDVDTLTLSKEAITAIKEALAQPEPWEKFCDSNCVWTDHHPDCKLAEQEPVAWRAWVSKFPQGTGSDWVYVTKPIMKDKIHNQPLYTTPPQRKPLTDEDIILIVADCASSHQHTDIHFARAIEAAHGIKRLV